MNIQLIHIEQLTKSPHIFKPPHSSDYQYIGIAIEDQGFHYYWARGISLRIATAPS